MEIELETCPTCHEESFALAMGYACPFCGNHDHRETPSSEIVDTIWGPLEIGGES